MQYALVDGVRTEADKGLVGICEYCGSVAKAYCGDQVIWHWKHQAKAACDSWGENETEWHRNWKNYYPNEWHEVIHKDENGERHRSDIKRPDGFFIEFQHSPISHDEIDSRNNFYKNIVWVLNGARLKSDLEKFKNHKKIQSIEEMIEASSLRLRIISFWEKVGKHIFIDFQDTSASGKKRIFYLCKSNEGRYLYELSIEDFVRLSSSSGALKPFIQKANETLSLYLKMIKEQKEEEERKAIAAKEEAIKLAKMRIEWEKKYKDPFRDKYKKRR